MDQRIAATSRARSLPGALRVPTRHWARGEGTADPGPRRGGAVDDAGESGVLTGEAQNLPGEQLAVGANLGVYLSLHAVDPVFRSVGCDQDCAEDGDAHGDDRDGRPEAIGIYCQ